MREKQFEPLEYDENEFAPIQKILPKSENDSSAAINKMKTPTRTSKRKLDMILAISGVSFSFDRYVILHRHLTKQFIIQLAHKSTPFT